MKMITFSKQTLIRAGILSSVMMLHGPPRLVAQQFPLRAVPMKTAPPALVAPPAPVAPAVPTVPTVRRLTLDEARQLALANNKALALARMNVDEKQHVANAARKDYFPKLLGSL